MYSGVGLYFLGLILVIWVSVLTYLVWREQKYLKELFPKNEDRDIRNKLKEVIEIVDQFKENQIDFSKKLRSLAQDGLGNIQRVEVLKYNPYGDIGGNVSFTVAFLDGKLNGMLLTSLHSRVGTRIYVKEIKSGSSEVALSKEEKEVLDKVVG